MLKGIFRFVVLLAVIVIAIDSAWSLWIRLDPYYALSVLGFDQNDVNGVFVGDDMAASQFDTAEPEKVEVYSGRVDDKDTGLSAFRPLYSIIPIYVQNSGKHLPDDFIDSFSARVAKQLRQKRRANGLFPRPCPAKYGSDILVRFHQSSETKSVFDGAKVAIAQYSTEFLSDKSAGYIVIQYVKADTDNDGELTCNDHRSLAVYDLVERELLRFDLDGGEPVWDAARNYQRTRIFGIGVDENGDGWHDRTRESVRIAYFDYETKSLEYLTP